MAKPQEEALELLQRYSLRKTSCRLEVLDLLLHHNFALAHSDLEKQLGDKYDRVTLYRTLHAFEAKGVVHSINDISGAVKYALSQEACDQHQHHNHIHFSCTACGQTFCLNEVPVPTLSLPTDFDVERLHLSAQGTCKACRETVK
ncbi:Fur family ferric uptake transcriptional regulator [Pontibacter ummariensis]|uniref:Fur family transcriptional regulator, ferric uptake regulator n=1 Tax=Pontibacter ummariensis TaxID=1610492 RepID=A0A239HJA9_9BACT|nr:transcriptional repressor [Pontibacter ummariensis]PRY10597.1 Fur family ferric uptake transcriptional regulator [Pontibacter ummariensis]SNS80364.1 Fur family transcriptional regulator, ferric uptake regulator [Pontibacter ummariensis]